MRNLVKRDKPPGYATFTASDMWRNRFFRHFRLSIRATINTKPRTVEERLPLVRGFHKSMKLLSISSKTGHSIPANARYHFDQAPLELDGLFSKTVDFTGAERVHVKTPKVDWSRRQATLQLCFNATGPKVKPGICFRLTPKRSADGAVDATLPQDATILKQHKILRAKYHDVTIYYQKKAWFDSATCMAFARVFQAETKTRQPKPKLTAAPIEPRILPIHNNAKQKN